MTANPSSGAQLLPFSHEDYSQFSLDDDNVDTQQRQNLLGSNNIPTIRPSISYSSSNHNNISNQRFNNWRNKLTNNSRESSRLTDEIELDDADSGSDDLDLLPPFTNNGTNTTTKTTQKRIQKIFKCCSPYFVAPKCAIM